MTDVVGHGRLRWFGHLEQKCVDDWVSACRVFEVPGDKGRGRVGRRGENVLMVICAAWFEKSEAW